LAVGFGSWQKPKAKAKTKAKAFIAKGRKGRDRA